MISPPTTVHQDWGLSVLRIDQNNRPSVTGAPCSHRRTWDENDGAQPLPSLLLCATPGVKAFEKIVIVPCTLVRTWGTPPEMLGTKSRLA